MEAVAGRSKVTGSAAALKLNAINLPNKNLFFTIVLFDRLLYRWGRGIALSLLQNLYLIIRQLLKLNISRAGSKGSIGSLLLLAVAELCDRAKQLDYSPTKTCKLNPADRSEITD